MRSQRRTLYSFVESQDYIARARRLIPFGVSSSVRALQEPTPIVVDHASGSRIFDIDGNEYWDYLGGAGPMLLGHQPDVVMEAVRAQLERGCQYGAAHEGELELAERFTRIVACAEIVTFLSSGSDSVHMALGIARGATGRCRILKFDGHFHGWMAPVAANLPGMPPVTAGPPFEVHPVAGWPSSDDLVICPWNDLEAFEEIMESVGASLAAVIMEAIPCNFAAVVPADGFLKRIRELCDLHGVVLIFDEVITGFRVGLGGAQERLGVAPDMATFAKAMANGFPISAIAGREAVMSAAIEGPVRTRGTFSGNPVGVAAANATIEELERRADEIYPGLEETSARFARGLEEVASANGAPLRVHRVGSIFTLTWGLPDDPACYADMAASDEAKLKRLGAELLSRGVVSGYGSDLFVSTAHTATDIEATVEVFRASLEAIG